jgi:hypothetical protein
VKGNNMPGKGQRRTGNVYFLLNYQTNVKEETMK